LDDVEGSLDDVEVNVIDIDDSGVVVGHLFGNAAGLQEINSGLETFK
jgi:hypothetical protein